MNHPTAIDTSTGWAQAKRIGQSGFNVMKEQRRKNNPLPQSHYEYTESTKSSVLKPALFSVPLTG